VINDMISCTLTASAHSLSHPRLCVVGKLQPVTAAKAQLHYCTTTNSEIYKYSTANTQTWCLDSSLLCCAGQQF